MCFFSFVSLVQTSQKLVNIIECCILIWISASYPLRRFWTRCCNRLKRDWHADCESVQLLETEVRHVFREKFELFIEDEGFCDDLKTPYTIITMYVQEWHELINYYSLLIYKLMCIV